MFKRLYNYWWPAPQPSKWEKAARQYEAIFDFEIKQVANRIADECIRKGINPWANEQPASAGSPD